MRNLQINSNHLKLKKLDIILKLKKVLLKELLQMKVKDIYKESKLRIQTIKLHIFKKDYTQHVMLENLTIISIQKRLRSSKTIK